MSNHTLMKELNRLLDSLHKIDVLIDTKEKELTYKEIRFAIDVVRNLIQNN